MKSCANFIEPGSPVPAIKPRPRLGWVTRSLVAALAVGAIPLGAWADPVCDSMSRSAREAAAAKALAATLRWLKAMEFSGCATEGVLAAPFACEDLKSTYQQALQKGDLVGAAALRQGLDEAECGASKPAPTGEPAQPPTNPHTASLESDVSTLLADLEKREIESGADQRMAAALQGRGVTARPVSPPRNDAGTPGHSTALIGAATAVVGAAVGGEHGQVLQQLGGHVASTAKPAAPANDSPEQVTTQAIGAALFGAGVGLGGTQGQALQQLGNQMTGGEAARSLPSVPGLTAPLPGLPAAGAGGVPALPGVAMASGGCPPNLAHLANRMPRFHNHEIEGLRQQLAREDIRTAIQRAKAQGYSAPAAIRAAMAQGAEHDKQLRQSTQCAAAVDGFGTTDEQFLSRVHQSQYRNVSCQGIRGACLCSAIMNKIGAVGARGVAGAMACFQRRGQW